ncbi:MAG: hypothetical protein QF890_10070 [Myxococcota bacterium]|nr:hypothetical protein [Deltaproteobacteria bacterium]MCP4242013.1 hypothetical protein [bacterium]MDP6075289.1 hypothetical protein [Myxococcota bacterium]MBT39400.1 hypothetical protein [Deltaproteobacteria bacterium]MDP6243689.1 hypothetical protein [Myxococcota bacterium]
MARFFRWIGILILAAVAIFVLTALAARMSDGPIGLFAGGPLDSGERMDEGLSDWSAFRGVNAIDLQLLEPPRSRRVWIIVDDDGSLYIPSGFVRSLPMWKHWPHEALADGRAIIRIEGLLYPVQLVRTEDMGLLSKLGRDLTKKYELPEPEGQPDPDDFWVFRVDPRTAP